MNSGREFHMQMPLENIALRIHKRVSLGELSETMRSIPRPNEFKFSVVYSFIRLSSAGSSLSLNYPRRFARIYVERDSFKRTVEKYISPVARRSIIEAVKRTPDSYVLVHSLLDHLVNHPIYVSPRRWKAGLGFSTRCRYSGPWVSSAKERKKEEVGRSRYPLDRFEMDPRPRRLIVELMSLSRERKSKYRYRV